MPEYDKMTIEESLAQLNEDFDDSEWQQNLFIEYAESQSKEYQDLVFGRNAELTEKKDTPSGDTPQPSVNFNFGDIVWGFSKYKTAVPKDKILYNGGERRLGFVINYDSKSVTCLQIVSANNKDRYNKNLFAIKIKDYDPNHPTQEGFVLCNKVFVSPLEYEYPAVDPKTKKFMEINGNLIVIQEHVRGNDFFKLPQKYKDEVYNKLKEFNGTYGVPKLPQIIECNLNEEIRINDTLNKDLWDDNNELKEEVKDKLLDIADAFLDDLKEDGIDIQVEDIRLLGSNANYNYTDQSDLDLHIVAQIDSEKYEQQLYNCYKTIFNNKYDIKIKGREVEVYVEDVKAPAKSNGVYSLYTGWIKEPKKEAIPTIDYDAFEKLFDEWEDDYFDIIDDLTTDEVELEESIDTYYRAELYIGNINEGGVVASSFDYIPTKETVEEYPEDYEENSKEWFDAIYEYDKLMAKLMKGIAPVGGSHQKSAFTSSTYTKVKPILDRMNEVVKKIDSDYSVRVRKIELDDNRITYKDEDQILFKESFNKEKALLWKGQNYTLEPKNDFIRLYHQTNKENILSIIKNGLDTKKARKYDNPGEVIWLSNKEPEDYDWSYGNALIEIDLPKDYKELHKVNDTDYQCYKNIPSVYFNAIYLQTSYRKEIMKDFQNTLDLDKSIERFHKGELNESQENVEDISLRVFGEGKLEKGPMYLLPNGKLIDIPEPEQIGLGAFIQYKCHACVNAWLLYQKLIPGTLWDMNDETPLLDRGWVRGNLGQLPDSQAIMNYIEIPKKRITDAQYKTILEWLDYAQTIGVKSIEVNTEGMGRYKSYSFSDYTSDEIVDKIKKYYATNRLEESVEDDIIEVKLTDEQKDKLINDIEEKYQTHTDFNGTACYLFPDGKYVEVGAAHYLLNYFIIDWLFNEGIVNKELYDEDAYLQHHFVEEELGGIHCGNDSYSYIGVPANKEITKEQYKALGTLDKYYMDKEDGFSIEILGAERPIRTTIYYDVDKGYLVDRYRRRTSTEAAIKKYYANGRLEESIKLNESAELWDLDWYRCYNKNYDIFSTNNSYGGKDAYTWATNDLDYLDFIEDDEKVAKLKLKPCKLLFYNMTKDELDRLQDKYGKTMGKNWEYFDTVNPGDDEMNILNQEGYDGFYDAVNIYVKKEFLEVIDDNIQLNEKVEKVMDYDWDDHIPRCYVITTDDEMLRFIKNYQNWEQFKIVHDPVANLYIVGDPWEDTHMTLIDYAVDNGFYEPERAEVGKESEWDSIYDAIMNSTNQIYINFDDDDPEEYPFRKVFEFNNAPMYVYSYKEENIDDTPFLKSLKKLDEKFYQTKNHKYTSWDGQEKSYTTTEYNPKNDSKYKRLIKKPINELTLDEVKYIFAVKECIYMQQLEPYDTPEKAVEYYSNQYGKELEECYKFIHSLSFPLTIYRGIRVGNYDSSELNNITQELKISGKQQSRSWTTDINIYKNEKSKFRNITDIVACEIDSNIIDVPNTISNYVFYSSGKDDLGRTYPENEISLKDNFKQSDLHNLRFVNKEDIIERLIYRGESDYNYSKLYKKNLGGLFFYGDDQSDYIKQYGTDSDYGPLVQYELDDNAKLYKGISSEKYCHDNPELWNKKDPVFIDLVKAVGAPPLAKDEYSLADIEKDDIAADSGNPDVWFAMCQYVAKEDLESKGYDGAEWSYEDELEPHQLQIWNLDMIKRVNDLKENYWKESDIYDLIEKNFNVVDSIERIDTSKGVILPNGKIVEIDDVHDDFLYFLIDKGIVKEDTYSADPFEPLYHWGCIRYVFSDVDYSGYCSMSENYKPNDKVLETLKDVITESSYYDPIFSVEIGQNYRDYDLEVVKPDFVINRIKGYYSSGSLKESLLESKQDTENFKKWVEQSFRQDYPNKDEAIYKKETEDLVNKFESIKKTLKSPQNDYYYWIKQNNLKELRNFLDDKEVEIKTKKEEDDKAKEGAKLLYQDKDWKVYEITNYEASAKYGKGTKWCISGSKRWANGENGREYFNDYAEQGIQFYFFINADGHKYALAVYPDKNFEVFNDEDVSIAYIPDAPVLEEIPVDYYNPTEERIFKNLLFSNQLPNDLAEELIISAIEDQELYYIADLNDLVYIIDEWIPDGWMEYDAVANGKISKEEYEKLTGEEYDGWNWWDGDIPQVYPESVYNSFKLTDDNCLITKNNLINGVKQAYKKLYPKYMFTVEGFMGDTEIRLFYAYLDLVIFGINVVGEEDLEKYCYYELREKARNNEDLMKKLNDLGLSKEFLLGEYNESLKFGLREDFREKTIRLPQETLNRAMELFFDERPCKIEKVSIKKLVDDNGLLDDDDLESYHEVQWENKPAKEFSINTNKLNNMRASEIPYATERNGKLMLGDGRHRVRAAYNDGYDFIELPVIREVE